MLFSVRRYRRLDRRATDVGNDSPIDDRNDAGSYAAIDAGAGAL